MNKLTRNLKSAIVYSFTALFAYIFDRVYALFSHGVSSGDMSSMWIFLLCFGTVFYMILALIYIETERKPNNFSCNVYNSGTVVYTVGMLIQGILEIAGTSSGFILYYRIAGISFIVIGFTLIVQDIIYYKK